MILKIHTQPIHVVISFNLAYAYANSENSLGHAHANETERGMIKYDKCIHSISAPVINSYHKFKLSICTKVHAAKPFLPHAADPNLDLHLYFRDYVAGSVEQPSQSHSHMINMKYALLKGKIILLARQEEQARHRWSEWGRSRYMYYKTACGLICISSRRLSINESLLSFIPCTLFGP